MLPRLKHFFIYALLSTLTLAGVGGCRKDVESFRSYPPTLDAIRQTLQQVPGANTKTAFSLSAVTEDKVLVTPGGVRVFLTDPDNLFEDANGNPVPCSTCQTLGIEITEALDKSDIIAYGVPTTTLEGTLLESGGMVRVAVSCDGKTLRLRDDRKLKIQVPATDPVDDMLVFQGVAVNDTFLGWNDTGLPVFQAEWQNNNLDIVQGYEILAPHLDWINADRFINEPSTSFCVDLPENFNPENTTAYLVVNNIRAVAFLEYNLAEQTFCWPSAPIGFPVRIVTISKTADGQYWLGNQETEIGTDATLNVIPKQVSNQQVLDFLKSL
jgi:hypothetical protein